MKYLIILICTIAILSIASCSSENEKVVTEVVSSDSDKVIEDYTFYLPFNNSLIEKITSQNTISNTKLAFIPNKNNIPNSAVYFDGTQYIEYYGSESINLYRNFTLSCWVKPDNAYGITSSILQNEIHLFGRFTGANENTSSYSFNFLSDGRLSLRLFDSSMTNLTFYSKNVVPSNLWTHIAASFDGANVNIYINGALDTIHPCKNFAQNSINLFCVGARNFPGLFTNRFYIGGIDEIKIFKRSLSQVEVKALAK